MCKHCANLTEDKQIVHNFAILATRRLNERWSKERAGFSTVTPDDIDIRIEVTARQPMRGYSLLSELTKES